jgi:hypothetical protein
MPHQLNVTRFRLLGLMHGHFDIKNLKEDTAIDSAGDGTGGINTGIGVVIPVEKILETLDQPGIVEMRKKAGDELRKANGATADFAKRGADATPSRDANPKG